jgi:hypothetical protein
MLDMTSSTGGNLRLIFGNATEQHPALAAQMEAPAGGTIRRPAPSLALMVTAGFSTKEVIFSFHRFQENRV